MRCEIGLGGCSSRRNWLAHEFFGGVPVAGFATFRALMAQPKITADDVRHVAKLAAISLSEDEQRRMCRELDTILGFMAALDSLDVSQVTATFHAVPMTARLRADEVVPSLPRAELLQAAPLQESHAFAVPKVLDGDK